MRSEVVGFESKSPCPKYLAHFPLPVAAFSALPSWGLMAAQGLICYLWQCGLYFRARHLHQKSKPASERG